MLNVTLMTAVVVASAVGVLVDGRTLLNESVWVKPLKFGFAFALYSGTLAWLLTRLHRARRFGWWLGTAHALFGTLEVAAITLQAARGTFSHFNSTVHGPLDAVALAVITYGVPPLLLSNLVIAVLLLFQRPGDRALTRALRAGLGLAVVAMSVPVWLQAAQGAKPHPATDANGSVVTLLGGHGIGDPDGTGMPLTNWSVTGGDMRVPHFVGLHAIHVLLLVTVALSALAARRPWLRDDRTRARLVGVVALAYAGLLATVATQAARGQSLIHPDTPTVIAFVVVALFAVVATLAVVLTARRRPSPSLTSRPALRPSVVRRERVP
ncbi:hypothetical protein [Streptomyces sp. S186]|uniref:hypothetical protein n=1 Tax=Streptomyces sp. S186 TaxID=3434395 RepID=UPI003F67E0EB